MSCIVKPACATCSSSLGYQAPCQSCVAAHSVARFPDKGSLQVCEFLGARELDSLSKSLGRPQMYGSHIGGSKQLGVFNSSQPRPGRSPSPSGGWFQPFTPLLGAKSPFGNAQPDSTGRGAGAPGASGADSALVLSQQEYVQEWGNKPHRIALFVEPSPFAYVSGYKNRFQNLIKGLRELGDEVLIVTTDKGVPQDFHGAKVVGSWSFPCPWYNVLFLSLALSPRIFRQVADFKPDIIHCTSPGIMVFGALVIAKLLRVPLVMSYHTHVPLYIPKYTFSWLVKPMWLVIKLLHRAADLTLVTSHALGRELKAAGAAAAERIKVWQKGVDSESFNPRFKSQEMRRQLSGGEPEKPLIVHVGRLGAEKNLDFLKGMLERIPNARLAFVGDGPYRKELERMFQGMPVTFAGMLSGEPLSQAYASGDIFITPSVTETLGFVVLEAMASGVAVVAARAGGIPDIVTREGETGYLFTPGDLDDCVTKVNQLIHSHELRQKMATAAREEVEKFDWRASTRRVREDYSVARWLWGRKAGQLWGWLRRPVWRTA